MIFDRRTSPLHFTARPAAIAHYLGQILLVSAGLMLVPMAVAFASFHPGVGIRYGIAIFLLGGLGWAGARLPAPRGLQRNEGLCIAALTFVLTSFAVAIPLTGYGLSPLDAWFEAVSAVTTTGLSTVATVEPLPFSFHFGRSWTQWIGGLGVVVLSLAIMLQPGAATRHLGFDTREADDVVGGTKGHAKRILMAYLAITALSVLLIRLAGMPLSEAVPNGLAAVSTGGFATRDASLGGQSAFVVGAVLFACFLGATPFYLFYRRFYRDWKSVFSDHQFVLLLVASAATVSAVYLLAAIYRGDAGLGTLADAASMGISAQTTAGFSTVSVVSLGPAAAIALCAAMFVGGGLGSTAGGIKVFRLLILLRLFQLLLARASTTAHAAIRLRVGGSPMRQAEVESALGIIIAYIGAIGLSWLVFVIVGYPAIPSLFEVTSAIGTVGISTGITGPELPAGLKILLCIDMLLGRVETTALIILLFPGTWIGQRRKK